MMDLLQEFRAKVAGVGVFVESGEVDEHLVDDYVSLARLKVVDSRSRQATVVPGNYFDVKDGE
jgi:purine operon repressor